jgi:hypothetical protein
MPIHEIEYTNGSISAVALQRELDTVLEEYRTGGEVRDQAEAVGLDDLEGLRDAISFKESRAGIDTAMAGIIVAFTPAVSHIAVTFWDEILLPRLKETFGIDVLGNEKRRR